MKKRRKPRKVEDKKFKNDLWCIDVIQSFPESSLPAKCCFNKIGIFTLSAPDSQEMNIAFSLDDLFDFQPGKRYRLNIEEIPWDAEDSQVSN